MSLLSKSQDFMSRETRPSVIRYTRLDKWRNFFTMDGAALQIHVKELFMYSSPLSVRELRIVAQKF